ncbi:MAG: hypothetical protein AAFP17_16475 [Pseudomonadota bacterium]
MRWFGLALILCALAFCLALLSRLPVPEEVEQTARNAAIALAKATAEEEAADANDPTQATAEEPVETRDETPQPAGGQDALTQRSGDGPDGDGEPGEEGTFKGAFRLASEGFLRLIGLYEGTPAPDEGVGLAGFTLEAGAEAPAGQAAPEAENLVLLAVGKHLVLEELANGGTARAEMVDSFWFLSEEKQAELGETYDRELATRLSDALSEARSTAEAALGPSTDGIASDLATLATAGDTAPDLTLVSSATAEDGSAVALAWRAAKARGEGIDADAIAPLHPRLCDTLSATGSAGGWPRIMIAVLFEDDGPVLYLRADPATCTA